METGPPSHSRCRMTHTRGVHKHLWTLKMARMQRLCLTMLYLFHIFFSFKPAPPPRPPLFFHLGQKNQALTESCCHLMPVKKASESSASVMSSIFGFSLLSPLSEEDWCPDMTARAKPDVRKTDFRGDRGHSCSVTVQGEILAAHLLSRPFFFFSN